MKNTQIENVTVEEQKDGYNDGKIIQWGGNPAVLVGDLDIINQTTQNMEIAWSSEDNRTKIYRNNVKIPDSDYSLVKEVLVSNSPGRMVYLDIPNDFRGNPKIIQTKYEVKPESNSENKTDETIELFPESSSSEGGRYHKNIWNFLIQSLVNGMPINQNRFSRYMDNNLKPQMDPSYITPNDWQVIKLGDFTGNGYNGISIQIPTGTEHWSPSAFESHGLKPVRDLMDFLQNNMNPDKGISLISMAEKLKNARLMRRDSQSTSLINMVEQDRQALKVPESVRYLDNIM